jgi:hypothetical protein
VGQDLIKKKDLIIRGTRERGRRGLGGRTDCQERTAMRKMDGGKFLALGGDELTSR